MEMQEGGGLELGFPIWLPFSSQGRPNPAALGRSGGRVGTVFSITPSGVETVLYSFLGGADGSDPQAALVAKGHDLYSTTYAGGGTGCGGTGCGTIFKVRI